MKWLFENLGVHNAQEFRQLFSQFFRFGLVGVSNTAVSMACYYLVLWMNPDWYMVGSVVGTVVSIANAFFWNDKFVFQSEKNDWKSKLKRLGKTYVSYGGTSLLSTVLLWVEVALFGVSKVYAPVVNLIITIPLNFLLNKFWVFNRRSKDGFETKNE